MTASGLPLPLLRPGWPAPPGVQAAMSLRAGGVSPAPFDSLNLSRGVGDGPSAVAENRRRWVAALPAPPAWLHLEHGAHVLRLSPGDPEHPAERADAAWTSELRVVCQVSAADCLPVLFALRDGSAVAAAHAGWRGLAAGVLDATVQALCQGMGAAPADLQAWLGPCIGPAAFEVGPEVLQAFQLDPDGVDATHAAVGRHFRRQDREDGTRRWRADLPALATSRLQALGVQAITACGLCTASDPSRFFSYRRDGRTGRMAAAIWRA